MNKLPKITVHGRFQPPLHINHWEYVRQGFERADHVEILITNPFQNEGFEVTASWRNDPANNPFTYDERTLMFTQFFTAMGIKPERYSFRPLNIKDDAAFAELDKSVPNLINVYSEWSAKKVRLFEGYGLTVIKLAQPKTKPVSGTFVREIIRGSGDRKQVSEFLMSAGFMTEAVPGLMQVLSEKGEIGA